MARDAVFFYDFQSPFAYVAAHRVDEVLPGPVSWRPIVFGAVLAAHDRRPWSFDEGPARDATMRECERRAAALGLPLTWPDGWPLRANSIAMLRAALVADEHGLLREFSKAAYHEVLGRGRQVDDLETVLDAAGAAGLDRDDVRAGIGRPEIKQRLREQTEDAITRGVMGIPTVAVGGQLFWGDDRLSDAAAAAS